VIEEEEEEAREREVGFAAFDAVCWAELPGLGMLRVCGRKSGRSSNITPTKLDQIRNYFISCISIF